MKTVAEKKRDELIQKAKDDYESKVKTLAVEFQERKKVLEQSLNRHVIAEEEEDQTECKLCYDEENTLRIYFISF